MITQASHLTLIADLLIEFADAHLPPDVAQRKLAAASNGARIELLWEHEIESDRYHYDAILHLPNGTLSVAFCPDDMLPWPLRGAHRWEEQDVVHVNGRRRTHKDVFSLVERHLWAGADLARAIVDECLLEQEADLRNVSVADDEVRLALDSFRAERNLRTEAHLIKWLQDAGMSLDDLHNTLRNAIRLRKVEEIVAAEMLASTTLDASIFDRIVCLRSGPMSAEEAATAQRRLQSRHSGLLDVVTERLAEGSPGPAFCCLLRGDLDPAHEALLFGAPVGSVVGPIASGGAFELFQVLCRRSATEDEHRRLARGMLVRQWLQDRRGRSQVRWFWGRDDANSSQRAGK